jgi:hypothetical protein
MLRPSHQSLLLMNHWHRRLQSQKTLLRCEASSPVPNLQSTSTASTKSGRKSPSKLDEIPGGIQDRKNDPNIQAQATIQREPSIDSPSKQISQDNYKSLLSRSRKRRIQRQSWSEKDRVRCRCHCWFPLWLSQILYWKSRLGLLLLH